MYHILRKGESSHSLTMCQVLRGADPLTGVLVWGLSFMVSTLHGFFLARGGLRKDVCVRVLEAWSAGGAVRGRGEVAALE